MFSDRSKRDIPFGKALLLIVSAMLIASQLLAMVLVAQGQVEKAHAREVNQASQRTATAWCIETSRGAELKGCTVQPLANYSAQAADRAPVMSASGY